MVQRRQAVVRSQPSLGALVARQAAPLTTVVLALALAGCAGGDERSEPGPTLGTAGPTDSASAEAPGEETAASSQPDRTPSQAGYRTREEYLAAKAQVWLHGKAAPDVQVVREINPDEYGGVMVECLTEFGFEARSEDGGRSLGAEYPSEQEDAYRLAAYTCEARYPLKPIYYQPYDEALLSRLHAFFVDEQIPCLHQAGYSTIEAPSLKTFVEKYTQQGYLWTPSREASPEAIEACGGELPMEIFTGR